MKTKIFTLLFAIVASIGIMTAETHTGSCGDNLTWTVDTETGVLTISGTGDMNNYYGERYHLWYSFDKYIASVVISNGVTSIGNYAFYGCSSLTSVTIPNSVTSIGNSAFSGCSSLTSVTIPNSVTSIGGSAFYGCSSLTSVTIPNSVTSIGSSAFWRCSGLTSVTIPNSVTSISDDAFLYCDGLTSIVVENENPVYDSRNNCNAIIGTKTNTLIFGCQNTIIPNSVTSIRWSAFSYCIGLTSITIPSSVISIANSAFNGCSGLTSIVVENENPVYDSRNNCNAIIETATNMLIAGCQNTIIPNSVTSIGSSAFYGCSSLTSVTIPNSVTSIGDDAFSGIPNIVYNGTATGSPWGANNVNGYVEGYLVYNDASKTKLLKCSTAFIGEIVIPNSVTSIGSEAFRNCSNLTSVTIPNSVTSIGNEAFYGCSNLEKVTLDSNTIATDYNWFPSLFGYNIKEFVIGSDVKNIHAGAFYNLRNLTSITVDDTNPAYCDIDGILFTKDKTSLIVYPIGRTDTQYCIPNSVTSIEYGAFYGCSGLMSITIPNSVTSIGQYAFRDCSNLTTATIPNSVTSIGESAFHGCSNLTSVTIPNSITSIGKYAFYGCSKQKSITIPNNVTAIGNGTFSGCSSLTSVTFGSSVKVIEKDAFSGCNNIDTITCYSKRPPTVETDAFNKLPYSTIVYVLADYVANYQAHEFWGLYDVRPISTTEVETEEVTITPTDNTVDIVWPTITGATIYELIIRDTDGNIVCTLIFDAQGHLTQIAFAAPARGNAPEQTQTAGFAFTVTGLTSGTTYNYTLTSKDAAGNVLDTQTGTFTTDGLTGIEDIPLSIDFSAPRKVLIDGQLYIILPDNTRYNLQGTEVK